MQPEKGLGKVWNTVLIFTSADIVGACVHTRYIFTRNTLCGVNEEINDKWPLLKALSDTVLSARNMTRCLSCLFFAHTYEAKQKRKKGPPETHWSLGTKVVLRIGFVADTFTVITEESAKKTSLTLLDVGWGVHMDPPWRYQPPFCGPDGPTNTKLTFPNCIPTFIW